MQNVHVALVKKKIITHWFLVRFSSNFKEKLLVPSSYPNFLFVWLFLVKTGIQIVVDVFPINSNLFKTKLFYVWTQKKHIRGLLRTWGIFPENLGEIEWETNLWKSNKVCEQKSWTHCRTVCLCFSLILLFFFLCNFATPASSILGDASGPLNLLTNGFHLNNLLLVMNMNQISRQHRPLSWLWHLTCAWKPCGCVNLSRFDTIFWSEVPPAFCFRFYAAALKLVAVVRV